MLVLVIANDTCWSIKQQIDFFSDKISNMYVGSCCIFYLYVMGPTYSILLLKIENDQGEYSMMENFRISNFWDTFVKIWINNNQETRLHENRNAPSEIILAYYKMIHLNISKNNLFWGLPHFAFMVFAFITL